MRYIKIMIIRLFLIWHYICKVKQVKTNHYEDKKYFILLICCTVSI